MKDEYELIIHRSSGTSLDRKSVLPSIEPTQEECQLIHSSVRNQFQSLLKSHCPKVSISLMFQYLKFILI